MGTIGLSWTLLALLSQNVHGRAGEPRPAPAAEEPAAASPSGEPILIDWVHANDFSMIGLQPGVHKYHVLCGFRRGFSYLESRGVACRYITDGPLAAQHLAPHKLLFINLVSAEREPFLVSEIHAIRAFVEQGGSLFVITDHSNCYFHAHRLKPLLTVLGIRTSAATACEEPPRTLGVGSAWITVTRFREHPVTAGLQCLGIQTGGCVDPRYAVALTSERSWADDWAAGIYGADNAPGFLGDLARGPDESPGPLGVVLAKTLGQGRIVIVADQNMFADDFINYADNYRLWLNVFAWLLRNEELRRTAPYERWKAPHIGLFESYERAAFGRRADDGYSHAMSLINRYYTGFANDRVSDVADLLVFAGNDADLSPAQRAAAVSHLKRGRNVLVLSGEPRALRDARGLVATLLRGLSVDAPTTRELPHRMRLELPTGASIDVIRDPYAPTDDFLPAPHVVPDEVGAARNEMFLDAIRAALPAPAARAERGA